MSGLAALLAGRRRPQRPVSYEQEVLRDGPVGYWKADEPDGMVMADSSGNGNHAIYNPAPTLVQGAAPLRLGASGSMQVTAKSWPAYLDPTLVNVPGGTYWAMEAICKLTTVSGPSSQIMGGEMTTFGGGAAVLQYRAGSGRRVSGILSSSLTLASPNDTAGTVLHVVFECGPEGLALYENGALVAADPVGSKGNFRTYLSFLGRHDFPSNDGFIGFGSDFAVYDHDLGPVRAYAHARAAGLVS